jgi:GntR family transcriptional regulator
MVDSRLRSPSSDPVHEALMRVVRHAAATGTPLPGEFELAATLGATRQQVRRSLAELVTLGILHRRQGAATTVDLVGLRMSVRLEDQFEHTELLARLGYRARVEIQESGIVGLPADVAAVLDAPAGSPALFSRKRWFANDRPVMLASGYLLLPDAEPRELDESVFVAANQVWGEPLLWDVATPGVALLDEAHAADLDREPGAPVMTLELVGVSVSGRRLFHAFEHHDPEVVQYSFVRTVRPPWSQS